MNSYRRLQSDILFMAAAGFIAGMLIAGIFFAFVIFSTTRQSCCDVQSTPLTEEGTAP